MGAGRILVVDDDDALRETLAEFLEAEGYTVQAAGDGATALFLIERSLPDLVLLDMRMPLLDGPKFMRELDNRGIDVPVVVMTAAEDESYAQNEFHPSGFVGKPFHLEELQSAVDRFCAAPAA